ncbi:flavodoxin [Levilactobacillus spicheri]
MQRAAVVYFSQTGTTAHAANEIHRIVGGPLIEIHRQPAYPEDYAQLVTVAQQEREAQVLPTLIPLTASLDDVDTVFLGFPSWWAQPPLVIDQFLRTTDLRGKTIVPFLTSVSSTIAETQATLQRLAQHAGARLAPGVTANTPEVLQAFMAQYEA